MDEKEIMQGTEGVETDGFMDGWEETSPTEGEPEETGAAADGGDQAIFGDAGEAQDQSAAGEDQAGVQQEEQEKGGQDQGQGDAGEDQAGAQQEVPRTWTLNHLGQAVTASEEDMVILAQKGLDYDRIRGEYDEAKPVMAMFREFAGKAGMDLKGYLAHIRAQAKQAEGMSEAEARRVVELEDREAVLAAQEEVRLQQEMTARQEEERRSAAEARMAADLREFQDTFPEAAQNPQSIPPEVWAEVRNGRSLVGAYARYHEAQVKAAAQEEVQRAAAQRQNAENAGRSMGSMRSAGSGTGPRDPFLEGWDE